MSSLPSFLQKLQEKLLTFLREKYSLYLGNVILPKMPYSDSGRRCWNQCPQYQLLANKLLCSLPPVLIYHFSPSLQYVTIKQSTIYLCLVNQYSSNIPFFFRLLCFAYYYHPGGPVKWRRPCQDAINARIQTGRGLRSRGDLRGRGTRIE